ncbi:MAG: transcriptional repressor [Nitriliruptoraceae bacterium]|nr:transcriptional repressor [Nitriliruptoraceae bacterium]
MADQVVEADLDEALRSRGYRVTAPRRAVWEALELAEGHLTVEEVHRATATVGYDVDLASVYRTLSLYEQLGLARASRLGDSDANHWELAHPDEHFHLLCAVCGDVDHHVGSLVASIRAHLDEGHGFAVDDVELTVTGRCARCRGTGTERSG